jgi:hypothetical protein
VCVCTLALVTGTQITSFLCFILCHLWLVWLYHDFQYHLRNPQFLGKKKIKHKMCAVILSATFVSNIHDSKKNSAKNDHKCKQVLMSSTQYSCQILIRLEFPSQIFYIFSNITGHNNPPIGSPCSMRTEGHHIANSCIFCNFVNVPNNADKKLQM